MLAYDERLRPEEALDLAVPLWPTPCAGSRSPADGGAGTAACLPPLCTSRWGANDGADVESVTPVSLDELVIPGE